VATHSPEWARYTHRVLNISDGRLQGEEIHSAPLELAAAEFSQPDYPAATKVMRS
jgi:ABC-type lipoprotein export system ATPase subunit